MLSQSLELDFPQLPLHAGSSMPKRSGMNTTPMRLSLKLCFFILPFVCFSLVRFVIHRGFPFCLAEPEG